MLAKILLLVVISWSAVLGSKFKYPEVRRDETVVDDYFGTKVHDPYRWLENLTSEETQSFVKAQNNLTNEFLSKAPSKSEIRKLITKLWTYPKEGLPKKRGDNYYLYKNSGVQNQWVMYTAKTLESLYNGSAVIFLDPNNFSTDGTVSLTKLTFSEDGNYAAYTLSQSGSDWTKIHIRNVTSGKDVGDVLGHTKFTSISWTHDNLGFFYTRYAASKVENNSFSDVNQNERIYYHRVGTSQDKDTLMVQFPDHPHWSLGMTVTDDGEYLLIYSYEVINAEYYFYTKLTDAIKQGFTKELKLIPLVTEPASYSFVTNDGPIFYFITNEGAPNYKFIGMDVNFPDKAHWATLIPEGKDVLSWAAAIDNDKLITSYLRDVKSTLELRNLKNGTLIVEYPLEAGAIQSNEGRREDSVYYVKLATFTNPGITYRLDFGKNGEIPRELKVFKRTAFDGLDTTKFETNQVFYESKDGTKVPMFITKRKGLELKGDAPTLMYGYGGFSSSQDPFFSVAFLSFVDLFDGVFVIVNTRGGGEYGTKWWDGGRLFQKQNVFDDFAYAAEYLIKANYTKASKLTIQGGSNGGLLVGACINQRPDLFGAAIAEVGVMDMLRFQRFTVGSFWCGEYGCSDDMKHFSNLIKYSPLHNIRENVTYPAVLVKTADTDDRVVPLHSYKYISQLQKTVGAYENQTQPLMIRIEEKAGHGAGKPTWKQIEEYVDNYAFLELTLGYKLAQTKK